MMRGPLNPSANSSTLNPAGTWGIAEAGRGTDRGALATEDVAPGLGKSAAVKCLVRPGLSARQSPNASRPSSEGPDWARTGLIVAGLSNPKPASTAPTLRQSSGCRIHSSPGDHGHRCTNRSERAHQTHLFCSMLATIGRLI